METTFAPATAETPVNFRRRYCELHGCRSEQFERHLFRRAIRGPWGLAAGLCLRVWPRWFRRDIRELAAAGNAVSLEEIKEVASDFRKSHDPRETRTFLRDVLGIRISGRKLMAEAQRIWAISIQQKAP